MRTLFNRAEFPEDGTVLRAEGIFTPDGFREAVMANFGTADVEVLNMSELCGIYSSLHVGEKRTAKMTVAFMGGLIRKTYDVVIGKPIELTDPIEPEIVIK